MIYFSVLIAGIIENIGTLSRYRLPFYISFILFSYTFGIFPKKYVLKRFFSNQTIKKTVYFLVFKLRTLTVSLKTSLKFTKYLCMFDIYK